MTAAFAALLWGAITLHWSFAMVGAVVVLDWLSFAGVLGAHRR